MDDEFESKLVPRVETFSGRMFYFLTPVPEMMQIEDIAHALANQCRFGGHTRTFYSVAEHSVLVSRLALDPIEGLLHDCSEAWLVDIPRPIKPQLANYYDLENRIMLVAAEKYGFCWPIKDDTSDADVAQLKSEAACLMHSKGEHWTDVYKSRRERGIVPYCWTPEIAERAFLDEFHRLMKVRSHGA